MAEIITMPRLSDTMTEGVVAKWLKKVGDKVSEGDILAEIETDKATMEFESFHNGELLYIGIEEGKTAPVDSIIAIIGESGEEYKSLLEQKIVEEEKKEEERAEAPVEVVIEEEAIQVETPEGVEVITMPKLSDTMTEGTVAKWLKKVGDKVSEGDILAEIESDKATMEFESFYQGSLLYIGISEGESAKVDSVLAVIGKEGTDISGLIESFKRPAATSVKPKAQKENSKSTSDKVISSTQLSPVEMQTVVKKESNGRVVASPLAKKLALEKNINLERVQGSGEGGRIIKRDVENYVETGSPVSNKPFVPRGQESFEEITNSQMRKVIARRLAESKFTAPHYYLNVEFDMDNAISFRNQYNSLPDTKISFNDIVIKATAMALKQHPQVNSQWFDDRMKINHHVHIGVAVAVEDGLLVPVLKFADEQSLTQIGSSVKDFAGRARNKKLAPNEMEGSTFTISNLGMFGITDFTSIINQPNSAILSVGAIVEKPVVKEGKIVVGNTMKLTLACDHRTVDGATGALFLQTLKGYIENPITMLL
ncbi:pyruvate dehydrogenase complex dihydrolipoamide acetyltransferase [Namhaeicola litoreus]|uniref:Acetyltransferase component of pyruvate dehydrogenase complex n=1 Tax=Namhaeicola litoreus TaxID=1052145 RepID=A0ABW3Y3N5_9FLAO